MCPKLNEATQLSKLDKLQTRKQISEIIMISNRDIKYIISYNIIYL